MKDNGDRRQYYRRNSGTGSVGAEPSTTTHASAIASNYIQQVKHLKPFTDSAEDRIRCMLQATNFFGALDASSTDDDSNVLQVWQDGLLQARNVVLRRVNDLEIQHLEDKCECSCKKWRKVYLMIDMGVVVAAAAASGNASATSEVLQQSQILHALSKQVRKNRFFGTVAIGLTLLPQTGDGSESSDEDDESDESDDDDDDVLPMGVHDNRIIKNCILEPRCCVHDNKVVESTLVQSGAVGFGCAHICRTANASTVPFRVGDDDDDDCRPRKQFQNFGSAQTISVGPEAGPSRTARYYPESTLLEISYQLGLSTMGAASDGSPDTPPRRNSLTGGVTVSKFSSSKTSLESSTNSSGNGNMNNSSSMSPLGQIKKRVNLFERASSRASECPLNIISSNAKATFVGSIQDVYLAPYAALQHATHVHNVTLLSHASITTYASATNVILQWNASLSSKATASNSFFMEQASLSTNGTCTSSIVGPDSHMSQGEVHHCVLGPHVNAHHQSLLISTMWLTGRGNVAYGANVGSNHTGRAADQECFAPEGMFWGLSCIIQFPQNLSYCPYSIVAAGVQLPPRSKRPIRMPFSLFTNNHKILPGWVLQHSAYTLARAEQKYAHRTKAKRHAFYTQSSSVTHRPAVIDLCVQARETLTVMRDQDEHNRRQEIRLLSMPNAMNGSSVVSTSSASKATSKLLYNNKKLRSQTSQAQPRPAPQSPLTPAIPSSPPMPSLDIGGGFHVASAKARDQAIGTYKFLIQRYALRGLWERLRDLIGAPYFVVAPDVSSNGSSSRKNQRRNNAAAASTNSPPQEYTRSEKRARFKEVIISKEFQTWITVCWNDYQHIMSILTDQSGCYGPILPWEEDDSNFVHCGKYLLLEFLSLDKQVHPSSSRVKELLMELIKLEHKWLECIISSKTKDDDRREQLLPPLNSSSDKVIRKAAAQLHDLETTIMEFVGSSSSRRKSNGSANGK